MVKLSQHQRVFALEFLACGNVTKAAIKAGCDKKTTRFIKKVIKAAQKKIPERSDIMLDENVGIVKELIKRWLEPEAVLNHSSCLEKG